MKKTALLIFVVISVISGKGQAKSTPTEKDWKLAKKRTSQPPASALVQPSSSKNFFFCGYMGTPLVHKVKMSDYFDRVFMYQKSDNSYSANFLLQKPFKVQKKEHSIFWFSLDKDLSGNTTGFSRKVFELHHFHTKKKTLTRFLVYYLQKEDYKKNFQYRTGREMTEPLNLIEKPLSKKQVKKAYGASWWRCRGLSYFKYVLYSLRELFFQIGGV